MAALGSAPDAHAVDYILLVNSEIIQSLVLGDEVQAERTRMTWILQCALQGVGMRAILGIERADDLQETAHTKVRGHSTSRLCSFSLHTPAPSIRCLCVAQTITLANLPGHRGLDVSGNTRYKRRPSNRCGNL